MCIILRTNQERQADQKILSKYCLLQIFDLFKCRFYSIKEIFVFSNNTLANILQALTQNSNNDLARANNNDEDYQARLTRLLVPPAERHEVQSISNEINIKMQEIKQLFSGRAGYAQIETACTELADDMSRQKWIPPGEDMKATYGIFGFTSAKNAVNDLHEYAQTIIDILNTPNCDVQTKREMLNEIKLTVETTVETLKKSLSEKDRKVPHTCNTIEEAFFALMDSVAPIEQRDPIFAEDVHRLSYPQWQNLASRPTDRLAREQGIESMEDNKTPPLIEVGAEDLPVYCPGPRTPRWSAHPRVFIDVTHGEARCAYCGTRYRLRADTTPLKL